MRVVLAGGGTGGHVIPALAIAREMQSRYAAQALFVGTARGIENRLVPAAGFELKLVKVGALKNVSFATRARTLFDLPMAVLHCWRMLRDFRPDVVIGVGGYASGPAMLAAIMRRTPTLAFEPNIVPGFANRAVGKMVSAAAVHFRETSHYFRNARVTGVPVRAEFFQVGAKASAADATLLVFGGSQGAAAINRIVIEALPRIAQMLPQLRIVHQTGERDYEQARVAYSQWSGRGEAHPFIYDMPAAFAQADLLLCRSGASTVAEITASGKPAIFVPFPRAADDHQLRNAEALEKAGAAVVIPESQLSAEMLAGKLHELLKDRHRLEQMSAAARALAHREAATDIAAMAAQLAGHQAASNSHVGVAEV
jgi:UDP-N-acetylglucosamine--N-acetylmuramyl-(pentapeptide) pyrophosphoryl-undecaprenol N-acetylglucosamine transferase